jgi:uncharacterized protein with HEPN domain
VIARSLIPRLTDIIEAIERIRGVVRDTSLEAFENDWQRQWLVERGVEIISEASRHLTDDLKARNPEVPWQKIAGIGNVLRHNYENIAAPVLWKLVQADLPSFARSASESLRQPFNWAFRIPFSAARYSFRSSSSWSTVPVM